MIYYEVVHQVVVLASNFHNPSLSYSLQPVNLGAWTLILYGRAHPLESLKTYSFFVFFFFWLLVIFGLIF